MTTKSTSTALGTAVDIARAQYEARKTAEGNRYIIIDCFYLAAMSAVINHLAK